MLLQWGQSVFAVTALEGLQGRTLDDGDLIAGELIGGEELPEFQLDELDQLGVIHHVHLVQVDDDEGDTDLAGEQDVLSRLGHGTVVGSDDQDSTVHLGGTGDHVLDIVGVARAVDVGIVALVGLVLHVGRRDRDTPFLLLGGLIYLIKGDPLPPCPCWRDTG